MELKPRNGDSINQGIINLLIVPYGIETIQPDQNKRPSKLLIVPYGIETQKAD